ncbi:MAG: DNA polymerase IV [Oscillospiraceae bacterium]|nr:DNA polymerase IV [Oscillospiraceae bacterium]
MFLRYNITVKRGWLFLERVIFHIDVNSAFLSWEAAKRVKNGEEDISLIPSAIGGDRDKRTGVILAKSIPAKKFGIKTGEPVAMALKKCPELYLAKPDFRLYVKCSKAFMDICREYTPVVEKYSIDECFLDMTGMGMLFPDPVKTAHEIKDRIFSELGFTVNVGIGPCKILAKMASDFEKPNRVHTLFKDEIKEKMWPLPVKELFSVGHSTAEHLESAGIKTIGDLANCDLKSLKALIGDKIGKQIFDYANGIDPSPVLEEPEEAKGYSISTTLEEDVVRIEEANKILLALADSVSARMRADEKKTFCIGVTIRGNDFKNHSHQQTLFEATDITAEIYSVSRKLFAELWDKKTPLRLLGISLTQITAEDNAQLSFFPTESREKERKIDKAMDEIRSRFGSTTVVRAANYQSELDVGKKYRAQLENRRKEE